MQRRHFLHSALATTAAGLAAPQPAATITPMPQEFYQLRTYTLRNGPQLALTESYFATALIPALNRIHLNPVGSFRLDIGPETPTCYLLIPSNSAETLATLDTLLAADSAYIKTSAPFLEAPATAPPFEREERTLLSAFAGWPHLTAPRPGKRIFQLRTYESPSHATHLRKVDMFNSAEIAIFTRTGLHPVFFGQTLIGPRMPSLTYMLTFADTAELTAHWQPSPPIPPGASSPTAPATPTPRSSATSPTSTSALCPPRRSKRGRIHPEPSPAQSALQPAPRPRITGPNAPTLRCLAFLSQL